MDLLVEQPGAYGGRECRLPHVRPRTDVARGAGVVERVALAGLPSPTTLRPPKQLMGPRSR